MTFAKGFGPGGVERIALRLAGGWRCAGLPVSLMMASLSGPMRAGIAASDIILARGWPLPGRRWPLLRLAVTGAAMVDGRRPAILFCPGNAYMGMATMLKILLGRRCPPIVAKISNDLERRDLGWPQRAAYHLWLRIVGRLIDHFAVLSRPMAREAERRLGISPDRIHLVPNPVLSLADIGAPTRAAVPGHGRRFIAVGRLERQKNYPLMLRAFAAGHRPGDRLTVLGAGRQATALAACARRLGIAGDVHFAGHCDDVRAQMARHDVLLLTSDYEGQPGAVIEALSVGLGIVATRCCAGIAELLDDGALGVLVDRGDEQGLAIAIAAATPDMQDRDRANCKAREFTLEAAVPAYVAMFNAIVRQHASARHHVDSPGRGAIRVEQGL